MTPLKSLMELSYTESRGGKKPVFLLLFQSIYENTSVLQEADCFFTLHLVSVLRSVSNVPDLGS